MIQGPYPIPTRRYGFPVLLHGMAVLVLVGISVGGAAWAAITVTLEEGISVHLSPSPTGQGLELSLACSVPADLAPVAFYRDILDNPDDASAYADTRNVAIPFERLSPVFRRRALEALFPGDAVDAGGWRHRVVYAEQDLSETLWSLSAWLTGNGLNWHVVRETNAMKRPTLVKGDSVLIPVSILRDEMKADFQLPKRAVDAPASTPDTKLAQRVDDPLERELPLIPAEELLPPTIFRGEDDEPRAEIPFNAGEIKFGKDDEGDYATYELKAGEAIYSDVVIRFTDFTEYDDVMYAVGRIVARSGINDVTRLRAGESIRIPLDMLSDQYKPMSNLARQQYERSLVDADKARTEIRRSATSKDLDGIVVILDSGHGSKDTGTLNASDGLYEDEVVYDIVCRIKQIIESQTRAKVYLTLMDPSEGTKPRNVSIFANDEDEVLLTTPNFPPRPMDVKTSRALLNLRYYLANHIYDQEVAQGIDPRNIVFTSVHADSLHASVRGAMIYIPGAEYRVKESSTNPTEAPYTQIREVKPFSCTASDRQQDEALSRVFAETLYDELGNQRVRRHLEGPAIRNVIRKSKSSAYVPAVLRWNKVPTKILLETANMSNKTDRERMADPAWREAVANAYVNALRTHFGDS